MKVGFAILLFLTLILSTSIIHSESTLAAPRSFVGLCGLKCARRCAKAGLKDRCIKYCGICCRECKCVPSGTFGNKHECPCYRDKKNSKGKPKCP